MLSADRPIAVTTDNWAGFSGFRMMLGSKAIDHADHTDPLIDFLWVARQFENHLPFLSCRSSQVA
jgi:hypothetical protein